MPVNHPLPHLIALAFLGAWVWALAGLPANPKSRKSLVLWIAMFLAFAGFLVFDRLIGSNTFQVRAPLRSQFVLGILISLPFTVSLVLWRLRLRNDLYPTRRLAVVSVVVTCIAVTAAIKSLNKSCIFFDYHHDDGTAWCAPEWQAMFRR